MNKQWTNRLARGVLATLAACGITTPCSAEPAAANANCYPAPFSPPPVPLNEVTLIDATAPSAPAYDDMARALLARTGPARHVFVTFSALGRGEGLVRVLDILVQPAPTPAQAEAMPVKIHGRVLNCLRRQATQAREAVHDALAQTKARLAPDDHRHSEIVHALHETIVSFTGEATPLRLTVYSDGLEHAAGAGGISFYERGRPRKIDPEREMARVPAPLQAMPRGEGLMQRVELQWYGLGAQAAGAGENYSASALASWATFWTRLLKGWGVDRVTMGTTVLNATLSSNSNDGGSTRASMPKGGNL